MPRAKTHLTLTEHAVLGLLTRVPAHGYELQRRLAHDQGLGRVLPVEPAMVYATLKSLSGLELIDGEWDRSEYPPKAVYRATMEGAAAFERWLGRTVATIREVRRDFLVKLYFALEGDRALALDLIRAQVDQCREYLRRAEQELSASEASTFDALVLDSKVSAGQLTMDWLLRWQERLGPPAS
jgi:DNA-binding PadR family transcriptional regulator